MPAGTEEFGAGRECWVQAVLSNEFLRLVFDAENGETRQCLVECLVAVVETYESLMEALSDQWKGICPATVVEPVIRVVRGLLCMVHPEPGIHGCRHEDCVYTYPTNGSLSVIVKEIPGVGRVLVSRLRKDPFW